MPGMIIIVEQFLGSNRTIQPSAQIIALCERVLTASIEEVTAAAE
jgi:hypothetical protein